MMRHEQSQIRREHMRYIEETDTDIRPKRRREDHQARRSYQETDRDDLGTCAESSGPKSKETGTRSHRQEEETEKVNAWDPSRKTSSSTS